MEFQFIFGCCSFILWDKIEDGGSVFQFRLVFVVVYDKIDKIFLKQIELVFVIRFSFDILMYFNVNFKICVLM